MATITPEVLAVYDWGMGSEGITKETSEEQSDYTLHLIIN